MGLLPRSWRGSNSYPFRGSSLTRLATLLRALFTRLLLRPGPNQRVLLHPRLLPFPSVSFTIFLYSNAACGRPKVEPCVADVGSQSDAFMVRMMLMLFGSTYTALISIVTHVCPTKNRLFLE